MPQPCWTTLDREGPSSGHPHNQPALPIVQSCATVFAIHPGIVPAGSPRGLVRDWFHERLTEGHEVPPACAADLILRLAQGQADSPWGRFLSLYDDVRALIARAEETRRDNLYTLRLRQCSAVTESCTMKTVRSSRRRQL